LCRGLFSQRQGYLRESLQNESTAEKCEWIPFAFILVEVQFHLTALRRSVLKQPSCRTGAQTSFGSTASSEGKTASSSSWIACHALFRRRRAYSRRWISERSEG
jgi:hypothetical protein